MEEQRAKSKATLSMSALPMSSDDANYTSDEDSSGLTAELQTPEVQEMKRLRRNIAQRKKLATPSHATSNGSLEESVYSSLSNDMYSKIGSPEGSTVGRIKRTPPNMKSEAVSPNIERVERRRSREQLRKKLQECALTSESGTASVLEVIEPTSSEEEEFRYDFLIQKTFCGHLMIMAFLGNP